MGYQGLQFTNQEDFLFGNTIPYNPDLNFEELKIIQKKLEDYSSGLTSSGITPIEAEKFLDWISFNSRNFAVRNTPETPLSAPMTGQCAPTQGLNFSLLKRIGLNVKAFNTSNTIGYIPMETSRKERLSNSYGEGYIGIRHSVSLVSIPIVDNIGNTKLYKFLLDPTFRQFFLKKDCTYDSFFDKSKEFMCPNPGYFTVTDNLINLGVNLETAKKTELLAKYIISKGYFLLNEENAKLYGDTFVRASRDLQYQHLPIYTTGKQYIENFENTPMKTFDYSKEDKYTILPSEIKTPKKNFISKIINFLKQRFRNKPLALPTGNNIPIHSNELQPSNLSYLSEEELANFKIAEQKILNDYRNNFHNNNSSKKEQENTIQH